ncbi:MAG TPA: hypothetical protein VNB29_05840, partial [Chthoniobacterales bacterium]|nr:hypothetical protein [Chthoniobacterales bacterium]
PVPISVMMGVDGSVITCSKEGFLPESVDRSEKGPQHVGDLREVRTIGKKAYVVGMGRTAYRRDGTDRWVRIDQSVRYSSKTSNAGFNSIHGFSEKEIYAVGWEGEIWRYDGEKWTRCPSPAKRALFRVVCAPDGVVYAAGQSGTLVAGRKGKWTVIRQNCTKDDFYGGTWFRDRLYLSTDSGLFVLEGSSLKAAAITSAGKQKLKFRADESFEHLASTDEVMWSVGSKMAMYTRDGSTWTETGYR